MPSSLTAWANESPCLGPDVPGHVDAGMAWRMEDNGPGQYILCRAGIQGWAHGSQVSGCLGDGWEFPGKCDLSSVDPVTLGPLVIH